MGKIKIPLLLVMCIPAWAAETFSPVDISRWCNRGFTGEAADGWTGQGKNDMRNLPVGLQTLAGVSFEVIDPAKNGGRSCIILRPGWVESVRIPLEKQAAGLAFLHTSAWNMGGRVGTYVIRVSQYPKSTRDQYELEMNMGRRVRSALELAVEVPLDPSNLADWWNPSDLKEAQVGWSGQSGDGQKVGTYVYRWKNPYPGYWVTSVEFKKDAKNAAVPILLALTAVVGDAPKVNAPPEVFTRLYQIKEGLKELAGQLDEHAAQSESYFKELDGLKLPDLEKHLATAKWRTDRTELKQALDGFRTGLGEKEKRFLAGEKMTFAEEKTEAGKLKQAVEAFVGRRGLNDAAAQVRALEFMQTVLTETIRQVYGLFPTQTKYIGRKANFLLKIAREYRDYTKGDVAKTAIAAQKPGAANHRTLYYLGRGILCAREALRLAQDPQAVIKPSTTARTVPYDKSLGAGQEICINGTWQCAFTATPDTAPVEGWTDIAVPHNPCSMPWPKDVQGSAVWYRTEVFVPKEWGAKRVKVRFDAVTHYAEVFCNGIYCGRHVGNFSPFEVDLTNAVRPGEKNLLTVYVENETYSGLPGKTDQSFYESHMLRPKPGTIGIPGDVVLRTRPAVYVEKVLIDTFAGKGRIHVRTRVHNDDDQAHTVHLQNVVKDATSTMLDVGSREIRLPAGVTVEVMMEKSWSDFKPWGIGGDYGNPANLYFLESTLTDGPKTVDVASTRFGFREFTIRDGDFYLNGKKIYLQDGGMMWNTVEPLAILARPWLFRAFKLYRQANCNIVRNFTPVYGPYYDLADEMGMLCENQWSAFGIQESRIPGGDVYDPVYARHVDEEYTQWVENDYNHPSVVMWSTNNESFAMNTPAARYALKRYLDIQALIQRTDRSGRPVDSHGNQGLADAEFQVVNLHYPPHDQIKDWRKTFAGRAVILGEFYAGEGVRCDQSRNPNPKAATEAEAIMAKYYADEINFAKSCGLPGIMVHNLMQQGFFCPSSRKKIGPWADLFKDPLTQYTDFWWGESTQVEWPAHSGSGFRPRMISCVWAGPINFFDPNRVECTPNGVFDAIAKAFRPMPPLNPVLPPEVVVEVPHGPGANVVLTPLDHQPGGPIGVRADENGRAWAVLNFPDRYRITAEIDGRSLSAEMTAKSWNTEVKPGYSYIQRVTLDEGKPKTK